jgi:hypothetical protein
LALAGPGSITRSDCRYSCVPNEFGSLIDRLRAADGTWTTWSSTT